VFELEKLIQPEDPHPAFSLRLRGEAQLTLEVLSVVPLQIHPETGEAVWLRVRWVSRNAVPSARENEEMAASTREIFMLEELLISVALACPESRRTDFFAGEVSVLLPAEGARLGMRAGAQGRSLGRRRRNEGAEYRESCNVSVLASRVATPLFYLWAIGRAEAATRELLL
jgi:hypothetical protein